LLNWIWLFLVLGSVAAAAWNGQMKAVSDESLLAAKRAIELVIGLTGGMVFFLGLVRVASDGGLLRAFVRVLRPLLRRLFPEVPPDHPAMGAMVMNFSANMLGLGNAATPFGVKTMVELDKLNPNPGVATNAMALFLAINTSSIVLLPPLGTVMVRVAAESDSPFVIWLPTLFATVCSTAAALALCLLLARLPWFRARPLADAGEVVELPGVEAADLPEVELPAQDIAGPPLEWWRRLLVLGFPAVIGVGFGLHVARLLPEVGVVDTVRDVAEGWLLPLLIAGFLLIGVAGRVKVYDVLVEAGKEGLQVAVRIAPYLVAIMVAIAMFRASGALDLLIAGISPLTNLLQVPGEALPMALLRPLSGSGAFGVMTEILDTHGPDSFVGLLSSTLMGSTETTFYVLAVYLGAAGIRDARHILPACLGGDVAGFLGAVLACHVLFGHLFVG
jgi:spore maturation protein SpmA/spore maturation protein SpmB